MKREQKVGILKLENQRFLPFQIRRVAHLHALDARTWHVLPVRDEISVLRSMHEETSAQHLQATGKQDEAVKTMNSLRDAHAGALGTMGKQIQVDMDYIQSLLATGPDAHAAFLGTWMRVDVMHWCTLVLLI